MTPLRRDVSVLNGLVGRVRHVLVAQRGGTHYAATLTSPDQRTPVSADVPLPAPFTDRVLTAINTDEGELRLRDAMARRLATVEIGSGSPAMLAFTGERFLVAHKVGQHVEVVAVECAGES